MKTCIYAPCWLDEGERLQRNIKFLQYYKKLMPLLGADSIHLFDNASSIENINELVKQSGMTLNEDLKITRFAIHMPRTGMLEYPYCWRVLRQSGIDLPEAGYEKLIHIDTDLFILKQSVIDYINACNTGWVAFWDEVNRFPEAAFTVLNKDAFPLYKQAGNIESVYNKNNVLMEKALPYTHIEKGFHGGRFAERGLPIDSTMDFIGQCVVSVKIPEFKC